MGWQGMRREYGIDGNNGTNGSFQLFPNTFRSFRYFRLFLTLSSHTSLSRHREFLPTRDQGLFLPFLRTVFSPLPVVSSAALFATTPVLAPAGANARLMSDRR